MLRLSMISAISIFVFGCGDGGKPKTYAVKGKVTYRSQPCSGALVVFHPADKGRENDPKPVATVKDDGTYSLSTFDENDGAAMGDYNVTIVWNVKAKESKLSLGSEGSGGADKLGGRFGDPRNPKLKASVKKDTNNTFDFVVE